MNLHSIEAEKALAGFRADVRQALEDRRPVPCIGRDEWISESVEDRVEAVEACTYCAVIDQCSATAKAIKATSGVWAGIDLEPGARRRRNAA